MPWDIEQNAVAELPDYTKAEVTYPVQSLLSNDGIGYVFSSFVNNFAGFAVVAVTFVAMAGVGVAEQAGMMGALIRRLVAVAPSGMIAFSLIFIGVLSSVASDAGYLILIPLAVTSNATMIKRLGGAAWQKLHRWVYLAAAAAAVHFIMLVKAWPAEPFVYAALVAALLLFRAADRFRKPARTRNSNARTSS